MIRKHNNSLNVIVASEGVATASLPAAGTVITSQNLPAGAAVLVDNGMRRVLPAELKLQGGGISRVKIAQSLGATKPLVITHDFALDTAKVSFSKYTRATEQITAIGYNPVLTSGSLPSASSTHYYISVEKMDNDAINRSKTDSIMFDASTEVAGSQGQLATALAANAAKNISMFAEKNKYMKAYAIADSAAVIGAGATADIELGSKVLLNANAALMTGVTTGSIDLISMSANVTIKGAVVAVDRAYQIESVDVANSRITLTQPVLEPTAAGATIEDATGAVDFGVILEMTRNTFDNYKMRDYAKNRIDVSFSESFTPITELQAATEGTGTGEQAMFDEFIGMGNEGQKAIYHAPAIIREQAASVDGTYGVINIAYSETIHELLNVDGAKGNVLVYVELDGANPAAITAANSTTLLADNLFLGNLTIAPATGVQAVAADLNE